VGRVESTKEKAGAKRKVIAKWNKDPNEKSTGTLEREQDVILLFPNEKYE